ncbi:MAG: 7-cyano-7-deazaguanine synthase, partial [Magnetococcales bacterium]|nr:7-cyano-7-deazaguanine synthase [Magnetococcales bacterium]
QCASKIANQSEATRHLILDLDLRSMGGSALTDTIPVPKNTPASDAIPITYVPARNTVFLSLALAWAETLQAHDLVIGVNSVDYSGYPDCRPAFIQTFNQLANLATREGVEGRSFQIHAPLQHLDKAGIIQLGLSLGVDFSQTHSCYDPQEEGAACGACDACRLREQGFAQLGIADPARPHPA